MKYLRMFLAIGMMPVMAFTCPKKNGPIVRPVYVISAECPDTVLAGQSFVMSMKVIKTKCQQIHASSRVITVDTVLVHLESEEPWSIRGCDTILPHPASEMSLTFMTPGKRFFRFESATPGLMDSVYVK